MLRPMKRLGFLPLFLVMLTPLFAQAAEQVKCGDEEARYSVEFKLDGAKATDLVFKDGDRMIATYSDLDANVSRFFKLQVYEFSLGGIQYFDLERSRDAEQFKGAFLFGANPLRSEVNVRCVARTL
jgi:hypothetical protein